MILYFSATGNSKYVATRVAEAIHDEIRAITDCIADNSFIIKDNRIGIVTPTYFWGLPSIVSDFLNKAEFQTDYLYFIATYGTTSGAIGVLAKEASNRKVDALYSVRMVDTYHRSLIFQLRRNRTLLRQIQIQKYKASLKQSMKNTAISE